MIVFDKGDNRFNLRSCAIVVHEGKVLLHKCEGDDFWALPGGRVEMGENADFTLQREMKEETGEDFKIGRLIWICENFFTLWDKNFHELSFLFFARCVPKSKLVKTTEFYGVENLPRRLIFRWFRIESLGKVGLFPSFLRTRIGNLPKHTEYLKHRDK